MFIFYSTTKIIYPDAPASGGSQDYFALFQIAYILSGNIEDADLSGMENAFVTPVLRLETFFLLLMIYHPYIKL
jgi:hypothetical protein